MFDDVNRPRAVMFTDRPGTHPDAAMIGVLAQVAIAEASGWLAEQATPLLILIEVTRGDAATLDLLDTVEALARDAGQAAVVIFPRDCLDLVVARIATPGVTLLCEASAAERMAAISFAVEAGYTGVFETRDVVPDGLQSLAEEVARIAKALASLAGETVRPGGEVFSDGLIGYRAEPITKTPDGKPASAGEVRALIRARRLRERFLPADLFGEPAWDMLLDLFAARIERTRVAVSSLCIAAAVPPTTALRTIRAMTERGLFERIDDHEDRRRVFIALTDDAAQAMETYVRAARSA